MAQKNIKKWIQVQPPPLKLPPTNSPKNFPETPGIVVAGDATILVDGTRSRDGFPHLETLHLGRRPGDSPGGLALATRKLASTSSPEVPHGMLDSMDIPMGMGFEMLASIFRHASNICTKKPSISSCQPVGNLHTDIIYSRWLQFKHQKKKHFLFRSYLYPVSFHLLPLTKRNPPKLEKSLPKPRHTRPAKPGLVLFWVAKA